MLFRKDTPLYAYEIVREGGADVMYINYLGASFIPRLADSPEVMAKTVDALIENPNISKIVFVQQRNYVYDSAEVFMLVEIAQLYNHLINQEKILTPSRLVLDCRQCLGNKYNNMAYFSFTLKRDPILAYYELKKFWREEKVVLEKTPPEFQVYELNYLRLLEKMISLLENTRLIREAISEAEERKYTLGSRGIYQKLFQPDIVPNFTFTRLVADLPEDAEIVEQYEIASGPDKSVITILKRKGEPKYLYHILPPEYTLEEDYQMLLNLARNVMIEHQPKAEEFLDFERTRRVFSNIARDLIQDLANTNKIPLNYSQLEVLANILVRHTIGFGVIEVLLQDERLQDIALNAPIPLNPIFVRHGVYDECETNIIPSQEDAESWAAKFRMLSGRPLDEASPILDTELAIKNFRARVAIIQQPLSPNGLAYAFRRHREKPWTLPLFIDTKMINPFTAGLMSFFIEGARTLLVAGTRSAGKCVKGDTLIQLANGDIKTIKELEHGKQEKISDGYIFYPNPEINVLSLDNNFKVNEKTVNAFWRRESPKEMIRLITNSGKEVITTKEHPYFIFDDKFRAVNAGDLKQEDFIATPRKIDINGGEILIPEAKEMITELRTNAQKITFPEKVNKELAEFLGYLIGDGHLDEHKIEFTNSDISLRTRFTEIAKKLFSVSSREIKDRNTWNVQITSRVLNRALNKLFEIPFGDKASSVRIPSKILKSDNKILAAFLRAYFDCDSSVNNGSLSNEKREIEIATASSLMAKQLQISLLRFGIISFFKIKNVKGSRYYRIFIRGEFFKDFAEKVGFNHPDKIKQANKLTGRKWIDNTNIDVIPNGNGILRELRKRLRVRPFQIRETTGKDYWAYENNAYNVSRKWFRILVEAYETRFKELVNSKRKIETLNINSSIEIFEYFRELLNIKNEEFAEKSSLATVTNFFSEVYKPRCETCKAIIDKIKEIYNKTVSKETEKLVMGSKQLAYSDIFWDRVKSVEKIKAEEEWVYDFTVEPFQNFVANGLFAHNTSLLGSLMLEIMPKYRIITVEDTLELAVDSMRELGYDIQRMKVRSALLKTSAEVAADEGIRTSLRLGDSCLIIGEVRSEEALALYESMRIGALANVVAGTIHGGSPYAVFDRVVNDLKVPITSFKATDLIIVANPIKSPSGGRAFRRVTSLSEVRKEWKTDPLDERGFVDLLKYNVEKDELEPTADLINGDSETIKSIASGVKGWAGNWDAVYDNILLRGKVKEEIVKIAKETGHRELLEAKFNCLANAIFYEISEKVRQEIGLPLGERVFPEWQKTIKEEARKFIRKQ